MNVPKNTLPMTQKSPQSQATTTQHAPFTPASLYASVGETQPLDYYDGHGKYLVRQNSGRWLPHDVGSYKRILKSRGFSASPKDGESLAEVDHMILEVQHERDILYHGPLCGRHAGYLEENGFRILVTEGMNLPQPEVGDWSILKAVLFGLFHGGEDTETGERQLHTFLGWMKSSVEALRAGRMQQQQALAICGPADCGKSLLQHLITKVLSGRSAKAERYFSGKTQFNSDLFGAEHLILEDSHVSTRISERLKLGAMLKEHCVGTATASLHAKGRNAVNVRPWWRVSITLNDDPEAMMILPPLDEHVADKIILLRASRFPLPMPVGNSDEKKAFGDQLEAEIPAFIYWLMNYKIPEHCTDARRYNVATWHHPALKEALDALSPETDLLDLLDRVFPEGIYLNAAEMDARLRAYDPARTAKILTYRHALATYLKRLQKKHPGRVELIRSSWERNWKIHPKENGRE